MREFDYSFLKEAGLFLNFSETIESFIEKYKDLKLENAFLQELEKDAFFRAAKFSNAIENVSAPDERIYELINKFSTPQNSNEEEIAGYIEAQKLISEDNKNLCINEENILKLHNAVFYYTDYPWKGKYKIENNVIFQENNAGRRRVRFRPPAASETPNAMEKLLSAYNNAAADSKISKLLIIPCFIFDFLCIHPFFDGNGRLSRLLARQLLLCENKLIKYISFEEEFFLQKTPHYESLQKSSKFWANSGNDYTFYLQFFLSALCECFNKLDEKICVKL